MRGTETFTPPYLCHVEYLQVCDISISTYILLLNCLSGVLADLCRSKIKVDIILNMFKRLEDGGNTLFCG